MSTRPVIAILQARVSSSRLPRKVLAPVLGVPMLFRQVERLRRSKTIDRLIVATSVDPGDDEIVGHCAQEGVDCFRGSLDDVLDRVYRAAASHNPEHVVRLTGDCPLTDPGVLDDVVAFYLAGKYDYASNAVEPTFPDGLDVEVSRFACLETAWREAQLASEREHITLFIYRRPERFRIGHYKIAPSLAHLRWTVDEPRDLEFVRRVYEALYPANPAFAMRDVLRYLEEHPEVGGINVGIERNEGLERSLARDIARAAKLRR